MLRDIFTKKYTLDLTSIPIDKRLCLCYQIPMILTLSVFAA